MKIISIVDAQLRSVLIAFSRKEKAPRQAVADIIERHFPLTLSLPQALEHFASVCVTLRDIANGDTRLDWQLLTELLGYGVAYRYDLTVAVTSVVEGKRKHFSNDPRYSWLSSKFRAIAQAIDAMSLFRIFAEKRRPTGYRAMTALTANPVTVWQTNQTYAGIRDFRRYGVKPSFFRTPMMNQVGWNYIDALDIPNKPGASSVSPETLAHAEMESQGESVIDFIIRLDGEFDCSRGYDIIPVREMMQRFGFEKYYEGMRLIAAVRLFDLTVSRVTVERTNMELPFLLRMLHKRDLLQPTPAFVIPRLYALERESASMMREIEEELESDISTSKRRNHRVEAHVRQLPPGGKPSKQALELARQHNFVLHPGETYVRKHRRGSGVALPDQREVARRY